MHLAQMLLTSLTSSSLGKDYDADGKSPPRQRRRLTPTKVEEKRGEAVRRPLPSAFDIILRRVQTRRDRPFARAFRYEPRPGGDLDIFDKQDGTPYACVRDSQIPGAGKGLYTCRDLKKGTPVGLYCGHVVGWVPTAVGNASGAKERPDSAYQITHTLFIDGVTEERWECLVDGARPAQPEHEQRRALNLTPEYPAPFDLAEWPGAYMHLINDADGPCKVPGLENNVQFEEDGMVVAIATVPGSPDPNGPMDPRSELLCGYGAEYWAQA
jgi:hypothetical protein